MRTDQMVEVSSKIEQGRWVKNLPNLPGVAVKVRGLDNWDYRRFRVDAAREATAAQLEDPDFQDQLEGEGFRRAILLGWSGIDDLEFSPAAAEKLLTDSRMRVFRDAVRWAAANVVELGRDSLENESKN